MIKTKYGNASINNGYYRIRSNEYGFRGQFLHRLIMAEQLGCGIPKNYHVHHIDGNKLNNKIENLQTITPEEHTRLHTTGENHPMYGKYHSDDSKQKMSESQNSSGYFRVCKYKDNTCKQGFTYCYRYYDEDGRRKSISSVDIEKLEEKVKSRGLEWVVFK